MAPKGRVAIVGLGSSVGDRREMLSKAVKMLSAKNKITKVSNIYETHPKTEKISDLYLNCCVELSTEMTSLQLMKYLEEIETSLEDQSQNSRFHHSSVDCDLISYNREVLRTPQLTLPHPDAHRRAFVMIPLADIKPDWVHPILNKTASELAEEAYWPGWGAFFADGNSLLDF